MGFKHVDFNKTKHIKKGGILSTLTGKNDVIYLRNYWQTELDNAWSALINMQHYIEDDENFGRMKTRWGWFAGNRAKIESAKFQMKQKWGDNPYLTIATRIKQDQDYSERMWKIHQDMYKATGKSGNYSRSFEAVNVTKEAVREYVKQYPKIEIKNDVDKIIKDEELIAQYIEQHLDNLAKLRVRFNTFKIQLNKLESKLAAYNKILEDGNSALSECRYNKSVLSTLSTAETRMSLKLNVTSHRVDQVIGTVNILKALEKEIELNLPMPTTEDYKRAQAGEVMYSESFYS